LEKKRKKFSEIDPKLISKANYFFPSATELFKNAIIANNGFSNRYSFVPNQSNDGQWRIMNSNCNDKIMLKSIKAICYHHYEITNIITNILFENLKQHSPQFNKFQTGKEKIKNLIGIINNTIKIRKYAFLDNFFVNQNVQYNIPMLFHIASSDQLSEVNQKNTIMYCLQALINNSKTTEYYNMLKNFGYKTLLHQFKKNFLLCENFDYNLYFGPLKYVKTIETNEGVIFEIIIAKYHARENTFRALSEKFLNTFSEKLALILNKNKKNESENFDNQLILDENSNLSAYTIQKKSEKKILKPQVISHIQKTCINLQNFLEILLKNSNIKKNSLEEIITINEYTILNAEIKIEEKLTNLNQSYYATAFLTAIDCLFNITNSTNVAMYSKIFKNMENYFKKQNLYLYTILYKYFKENNDVYHKTTSNIFLSVLLLHNRFTPEGIYFLDFFDCNNNQPIEIAIEKKETIFNNNRSKDKTSILKEKMEKIFSDTSIKTIINLSFFSESKKNFLSELFLHKSGDFEKIENINEINVEMILDQFVSACKKESYPPFINEAIEDFMKEKYFKRLLSSGAVFDHDKPLKETVFKQLSQIKDKNKNMLITIINNQKKYNTIISPDGEMIKNLDEILNSQNNESEKSQTKNNSNSRIYNKSQPKKNDKNKKAETNKNNTSFNYNKIIMPVIIVSIIGVFALYYRIMILKAIDDHFSKQKQQTITN